MIISTILISILAVILIVENVILFITFKRIQTNLKNELAAKFIKTYQNMSGRKLTLKEQQKLLNELVSEKTKIKKQGN